MKKAMCSFSKCERPTLTTTSFCSDSSIGTFTASLQGSAVARGRRAEGHGLPAVELLEERLDRLDETLLVADKPNPLVPVLAVALDVDVLVL